MDKMLAKQEIMEGRAVLGIEFGSTRIKAVLIGSSHEPLAQGSFEWENQFENGHAFSIMGLYCDKMFNAFVTNFTSVILGTMLVERFQNFKRDVWAAFINEGGLGNVLSGNVSEWPTAWTNKLEESNK